VDGCGRSRQTWATRTPRGARTVHAGGSNDGARSRVSPADSLPAGPVAGCGNTRQVDRDSTRKATPVAGSGHMGRGSSLSRRRGRDGTDGATRTARTAPARPADGHPGNRVASRYVARRTHEGSRKPERPRQRPKRRFQAWTVTGPRPCPPAARSPPGAPRTESPPPVSESSDLRADVDGYLSGEQGHQTSRA
jgi:hypothetical protein